MQPQKSVAIVPAHLPPLEQSQEPRAISIAGASLRGLLLLVALGLITVFVIAVWLNPYDQDGRPLQMETHLQLGLPPCTFRLITGLPCPSCGMTTSFALLMRGNVDDSLRANAVGTLLALFGLVLIPWSLACALAGRYFFIRSPERALLGAVIVFVVLLLTRWLVIVGLVWAK